LREKASVGIRRCSPNRRRRSFATHAPASFGCGKRGGVRGNRRGPSVDEKIERRSRMVKA
jgi:hypothetical protein